MLENLLFSSFLVGIVEDTTTLEAILVVKDMIGELIEVSVILLVLVGNESAVAAL